ncbi:carboxyl transferase domain-containing protein [Nonomuraea sp. NPDC049480]|uniref:carboxyl transferase domain-containing protein n=1 Tax=Nonomuraea sp. NPDC049480 TaxID=3364353 RepID=UPI00378BF9A9
MSSLEYGVPADDPLGFTDRMPYPERLEAARAATELVDACASAMGTIAAHPVVAVVMDFDFLGGSLGSSVGDTVVRAAALAGERRTPPVLVTASGGARMQEGALSLMQMARTSAAPAALGEEGVLVVTVATDPVFGGVAASIRDLAPEHVEVVNETLGPAVRRHRTSWAPVRPACSAWIELGGGVLARRLDLFQDSPVGVREYGVGTA